MRQRFGIAQALLGNPRLLIVDEPTAGLDPEERVRFQNLLSDIGRDVVVILSTHIVSDVRDLCPRMAVLNEGQVLLTGAPGAVIERLAGRIWRKAVERSELAEVQANLHVISTRLLMGRTLVHVYSEGAPDASFAPVDADFEDAYFAALMVMKKEYGPERMGKFLRYERGRQHGGGSAAVGHPGPRVRQRHRGSGAPPRSAATTSSSASGLRPTTVVPSAAVMMGRWMSTGCATIAEIHCGRWAASRGSDSRPASAAAASPRRARSQGSTPSLSRTAVSSRSVGGVSR